MIDPTKLRILLPTYPIDQIIGIKTGTVSLGAPSASPGYTTATDVQAHNFGDSCYFAGIFTYDGGTTWNDFGCQIPNYAAPNPQLQTVDVAAYTDNTNLNVTVTNWYDLSHGTGTARTVTYKVYLLAKNKMAQPITPLASNQKLAYSSAFNFQKIFMKDTVSINVAAGATGSSATITHNLGYIPAIRAFFVDGSNNVYSLNQLQSGTNSIQAHLTATTLVFTSDQSAFGAPGVSGNIDYRIYLDS